MSRILPIFFNTKMVRAILDGRKTVTRRTCKPLTRNYPLRAYPGEMPEEWLARWNHTPPYHPGDTLYVRETFSEYCADHVIDGIRFAYKADSTPISEEYRKELGYKWHPSIHMPREAARIFLRVTDVRVERLQEITKDGIVAEGSTLNNEKEPNGRYWYGWGWNFRKLWDSTIKPADLPIYGWSANPWVWVYEFERIEKI